jgi:hypothetical protein
VIREMSVGGDGPRRGGATLQRVRSVAAVSEMETSGPGEHGLLAGAEIWRSEDFLEFGKA